MKLLRKLRMLVKISFRELCDSIRCGLHHFGNMHTILGVENITKTER